MPNLELQKSANTIQKKKDYMVPMLNVVNDCIDKQLLKPGQVGAPCGYPVNHQTQQRDSNSGSKIRECEVGHCCGVARLAGYLNYEVC